MAELRVTDVGSHRHHAHDLDPARDDDICKSAGNETVAESRCLLRGSALRIDRRGRYLQGQPGAQPRIPNDVRRLHAELADTATHYLVNEGRIKVVSLDKAQQHVAEEFGAQLSLKANHSASLPATEPHRR